MKTTINTIVFDFDGVLVNSNAIKRDAYFHIFQSFKLSPERIETVIRQHRDGNRFDVIGGILELLVDELILPTNSDRSSLIQHYATAYNIQCETAVAECPEVSGATELLDTLEGNLPLYINSATLQHPLRRIVCQRGWSNKFQDVFGSPSSKVANLEKIQQAENCLAEEIVFVGDGQRDWNAAAAFGCQFIGVRNSFTDFQTPAPMEIVQLTELIDVLETPVPKIRAA